MTHHKSSVVPRSDNNGFASPYSRLCLMILFCCASGLKSTKIDGGRVIIISSSSKTAHPLEGITW